MSDLQCPYCDAENEVNHDDGFGYEEDVRHEMECKDCGRSFVFLTHISFIYSPKKADCLNGAGHVLRESITVPRRYTRMFCEHCEYSEALPSGHPYLKEQSK